MLASNSEPGRVYAPISRFLLNGQLQEYTSALWHVRKPHRDDLIGTNGRDILSEKFHRAGLGMQQTRYGLEDGGLTRTVSADKRDNLALCVPRTKRPLWHGCCRSKHLYY